MQYIGNKIYIEHSEAIKTGIPKGTLDSALNRKSQNWIFVTDPFDKRKILIDYEPLKAKYKLLIIHNICGGEEPHQYLKKIRLKDHLKENNKDVVDLMEYNNNSACYLNSNELNEYLNAVKYVSLLSELSVQKIKALGYKTVPEFYSSIIKIIKSEKIKLPSSYSRLKRLVNEYKLNGIVALIDHRGKTGNNKKVSNDQIQILHHLFAQPNQFDASIIAKLYNEVAKKKGWKTISRRTVLNYHDKYQLLSEREGFQVWRNAKDHSVKRERPSAPNLLWVGDATPHELLFQETSSSQKGGTVKVYHKRLVVYTVIDAFNDYVVGFAIGDTESAQLAKTAWKNACTWQGVLPHQIKTDNFSGKELKEFYSRIARSESFYTPSEVGNARDKVIEPFFARMNKQVTKFRSNYSGHNITAKQQPNREYLNKIKSTFPDRTEVIKQIISDYFIWNNVVRNRIGGSLEEQYLNADHSKDRILNDELRLLYFGEKHRYKNTLTNKGINITLNGTTTKYMLFQKDFDDTIGTQYQVIYDIDDRTKVLVVSSTKKGERRFVLNEIQSIPMAMMDMKVGDRARLEEQLQFKREQRAQIIINQQNRSKALSRLGVDFLNDPEKVAQLMFTDVNGNQKTLNYEAQNETKSLAVNDDTKKSKRKALPTAKPSTEENFSIYREDISKTRKAIKY